MRLVCFALMVAVALGVVGVIAKADTADSSAGGPAVDAAALPASQVGATESGRSEKKRIYVSVDYSAFFPAGSEARRNFGEGWGSIGIGRFRPERPSKWAFDWDVTVLQRDGASDALLIPMTVGAERGLSRNPNRQSYLAARVGPYYGKVDDNLKGPDDTTIGVNANLSTGMVVDQKYVLEARYDWFTKIAARSLLAVASGVAIAGPKAPMSAVATVMTHHRLLEVMPHPPEMGSVRVLGTTGGLKSATPPAFLSRYLPIVPSTFGSAPGARPGCGSAGHFLERISLPCYSTRLTFSASARQPRLWTPSRGGSLADAGNDRLQG